MTEDEFNTLKYNMFSRIVGCAFASYNYWRSGMDELTYEAGLYAEMSNAGFIIHRQEEFPIYYKGLPTPVKRRMDLVATDKNLGNIILELKALDSVGNEQRKQLWSYMRLTNTRFGMLINFGPSKVYSENWELIEQNGKCIKI